MVEVPVNEQLRESLLGKSLEELRRICRFRQFLRLRLSCVIGGFLDFKFILHGAAVASLELIFDGGVGSSSAWVSPEGRGLPSETLSN